MLSRRLPTAITPWSAVGRGTDEEDHDDGFRSAWALSALQRQRVHRPWGRPPQRDGGGNGRLPPGIRRPGLVGPPQGYVCQNGGRQQSTRASVSISRARGRNE